MYTYMYAIPLHRRETHQPHFVPTEQIFQLVCFICTLCVLVTSGPNMTDIKQISGLVMYAATCIDKYEQMLDKY